MLMIKVAIFMSCIFLKFAKPVPFEMFLFLRNIPSLWKFHM